MARWTHSNKAVYNVGFHLIWCPKYRRKVLVGPIEARLKELLREKADAIGVTIEQMEVMPDHLHLFVKCEPINSPHYIVQQLKGYTSRILRREFPTTVRTNNFSLDPCRSELPNCLNKGGLTGSAGKRR